MQGYEVTVQPFKEGEDEENPKQEYHNVGKGSFFRYHLEALGRVLKMKYESTRVENFFHNFIVDKFRIDNKEFENIPENEKYFQDELPSGIFNTT